MLPIVGVPETIRRGLAPYRDLRCREAGCADVRRSVTGALRNPNKTLQGLDDVSVWARDHAPSRRAQAGGQGPCPRSLE
jgi:hypothetical protein